MLIQSAIEYAMATDVKMLEASPDAPKGEFIAAFGASGFKSVFYKVGFTECARRGSHPVIRYPLPQDH